MHPSSTASAPARSLKSNVVWAAAGNAVYALCQWAIIGLLAKVGSPELVGLYSLGIAAATPVLMLAQLNLRSVLATDAKGEHGFAAYRSLRLWSLAAAVLAIAAFSFFTRTDNASRIIVLAALGLAVTWMSDIYQGLMQLHERLDRASISLCASGILSVAGLSAGLLVTHRLDVAMALIVLARLAVLLVYDAGFGTRDLTDNPQRSSGSQLAILRTAIPLGVVMMIGSLSPNIPRYFIAGVLSTHFLGIFAAIASLTTAANLIVNAIGQAATPRMAKLYASGDLAAFRSITLQLVAIGFALAGLGAAASLTIGRPVLTILFNAEYAEHTDLLLVLTLGAGAGFVASFLGYAITACRAFTEQVPLQAAAAISGAIACMVLIPRFGLNGAGVAVGVASAVQAVGEVIVLRTALRKLQAPAASTLVAQGGVV